MSACGSKPPVEPEKAPEDPVCPNAVRWCKENPSDRYDLSYVICIDARDGKHPMRLVTEGDPNTSSTVVPSNRSLAVKVIYETKDYDDVQVKLGGNIGHATPATVNVDSTAAGVESKTIGNTFYALGGPERDGCRAVVTQFSPRTPGGVTLAFTPKARSQPQDPKPKQLEPKSLEEKTTVEREWFLPKSATVSTTLTQEVSTAGGGGAPPSPPSYDIELFVPKVYSGAIRAGISGIFGATDHGYTKRKRVGSMTSEIVDQGQSRVEPEIVLGYTAFFEAFGHQDGRDYARKWNWDAWSHRLGVFVGVGVVGSSGVGSANKADFFRSLYIGIEYEAAENLSIALTGVFRKRDALVDGYHVGDPVDDGTDINTTEYKAGLALVANFSFDFFRLNGSVGK